MVGKRDCEDSERGLLATTSEIAAPVLLFIFIAIVGVVFVTNRPLLSRKLAAIACRLFEQILALVVIGVNTRQRSTVCKRISV